MMGLQCIDPLCVSYNLFQIKLSNHFMKVFIIQHDSVFLLFSHYFSIFSDHQHPQVFHLVQPHQHPQVHRVTQEALM